MFENSNTEFNMDTSMFFTHIVKFPIRNHKINRFQHLI